MLKQKIIAKLNLNKGWGKCLNVIQDIAEKVLPKKEWLSYLKSSWEDAQACKGMDGVLLNGQYFDWRQFETHSREIVLAYLNYFSDEQLQLICQNL